LLSLRLPALARPAAWIDDLQIAYACSRFRLNDARMYDQTEQITRSADAEHSGWTDTGVLMLCVTSSKRLSDNNMVTIDHAGCLEHRQSATGIPQISRSPPLG
jgi:hypothetical protein